MTKRLKRPRDPAQLAHLIMGIATGDIEDKVPENDKDSAQRASGRRGGRKGSRARADSLTPERRETIAKTAAEKRWEKD